MSFPKEKWLDAWHVSTSLNKDYDVIDGLRGIAILLVLGSHLLYFNPASGAAVRFIGGVFNAGTCGVTLFFTLSGFLISSPFWKRKWSGNSRTVPPGYGWRRFWKIYPPLALSVILLTPAYAFICNDSSYFLLALRWLTGVPLALPTRGDLNPVMWSLIVEVHFYILLPILFLSLTRVPAKAALWILFAGFLLLPTAWRWHNAANGLYFSLHPVINVHFPSLLDAFALGILVAGLEAGGSLRKPLAKFGDAGLVLLVASLFLVSWLNLQKLVGEQLVIELGGWLVKVASGLLLLYIADPKHPTARMLSASWLRWCGIISYEWYLFHQPLLIWARGFFGPARGSLLKYSALTGGSLLISLVLATLVYRLFSLPILRFGRSRNSAGRATRAEQRVPELQAS